MKRYGIAVLAALAVAQPASAQTQAAELVYEHFELGMPKSVRILVAPGNIRASRPRDRFTILYRDRGEEFTGLEERDGRYWTFTWPAVQAAVAKTEANKNLLSGGMDLGDEFGSAAPEKAADPTLPRHTYTWAKSGRTDTRNGVPVAEWVGTSSTGQLITAWATQQGQGDLLQHLERVGQVNQQMSLAVVRVILPPEYFAAARDLGAKGWVPLDITIGGGPVAGRERVKLKSAGTAKVSASDFTVPEEFQKTDSVAMEGLFQEVEAPRHHEPQNVFDRPQRGPVIPNSR